GVAAEAAVRVDRDRPDLRWPVDGVEQPTAGNREPEHRTPARRPIEAVRVEFRIADRHALRWLEWRSAQAAVVIESDLPPIEIETMHHPRFQVGDEEMLAHGIEGDVAESRPAVRLVLVGDIGEQAHFAGRAL